VHFIIILPSTSKFFKWFFSSGVPNKTRYNLYYTPHVPYAPPILNIKHNVIAANKFWHLWWEVKGVNGGNSELISSSRKKNNQKLNTGLHADSTPMQTQWPASRAHDPYKPPPCTPTVLQPWCDSTFVKNCYLCTEHSCVKFVGCNLKLSPLLPCL
jgi:hypothetical protein